MINLQLQYQKLEEQLEYIQTYIQSIELQKNMISEIENQITDQATLNSFPKTIDYSRIIKKVIASPIQYNAVIISIYGCFEQYIDNIFSTYCNELYSIVDTYDNLPDKLKEKHIKKLGDFLTNPQRYKNYDLTNVQAIKNAFYAFENPKTGFTNNQKLILSHSGNLKIEQISELANDLGIPDFEKSIANCYIFKNYQMQHNDYSKENYSNLVARNSKKLFNILEKIVDEYSGYVHKVVKNMVGKNITEEDEEEIIADTFFILWKNTEKLDKEKQITSYIAGVARNLVREKTRVININCDIADYENVIRDLKDIDMVYEEREKTELIRKATNQLKQEDITIFNLYYYSSRKIKEIANIMNIPEFKVKSRLYRIRKKLKEELEKGGYSYDG